MSWIDDLFGRHRGQEAWIFGKGPSLDQLDMSQAGPLRICVKESVLAVPQPTYFFSHNQLAITRTATRWPAGCSAVLEPHFAEYACQCGIPRQSVYSYYKRLRETELLRLPAREMARCRCLYGDSGTVHSAIHFCRLIGVNTVTFVGFDGGGGYAKALEIPRGGHEHARIRADLIDLLNALGISHQFFSADPAVLSAAE